MSEGLTAQPVDVTVTCRSFPQLPDALVDREHLLETIESMFTSEVTLVTVQGERGIGKTVLLSQFARRHSFDCLALFPRPTSRLAYDPAYLRLDLCNQLHWIVRGTQLSDGAEMTDADLRQLVFALQGRAKARGNPYYFILDGLDDIPGEDSSLREAILDLLPLGMAPFRFLVAADLRRFPERTKGTFACRSYQVPLFSLDESVRLLADLGLDRNQTEALRVACNGVPERLASVRRILQGGVTFDELSRDMPNWLPEVFEYEWRVVQDAGDDELELFLAIVAYEQASYTVDDLARLTGMHRTEVERVLASVRFVRIDVETSEVSFVSPSFRDFARRKLWAVKSQVMDLVLADLTREPDSDASLARLPAYLVESRQFDQLFGYLTPQRFVHMVERYQSLIPALKNADIGVAQAIQLRRDKDLAQLATESALLRQLGRAGAARAEVEARMALDDELGAMTLAQGAILKDDRLHLLAIIAKMQKLRTGSASPQITDEIRRLFDQIDRANLGKRALTIAADLVRVLPELAVRMVEDASGTAHGEATLDWAYAHLTLEALLAQSESDEPIGDEDLVRQLHARIRDPKARRLATAITGVLRGQTAVEALEVLQTVDTTRDQVQFLRSWTAVNSNREDAIVIVEQALKFLLASSDFAPSAGIYRDLAEPLPHSPDLEGVRRLVGTFDSQHDLIERQGPSQDYVRLQLLLLHAECRYNHAGAQNRLLELYDYVSTRDDLRVKVECFAWFVAALGPLRDLCAKAEMPDVVVEAEIIEFGNELEKLLDELLSESAEHYEATIGAIEALATTDADRALGIATRLNTRARRDAALQRLVEAIASRTDIDSQGPILNRAISQISEKRTLDAAVMAVLEQVLHAVTVDPKVNLKPFRAILHRAMEVFDASERCRACSVVLRILHRTLGTTTVAPETTRSDSENANDALLALGPQLRKTLNEALAAIDIGWVRVETGFRVANWLADVDRIAALSYLDAAENVRRSMQLQVEGAVIPYATCLALAIRAFAGVPHTYAELDHDLEHLGQLIDSIPSAGERATKWAALAFTCYRSKREDFGAKIVREHVLPLLRTLPENDSGYRELVIGAVAPVLYRVHHGMAREWIDRVARPYRDIIYAQVASYVLTKLPPSEPLDERAQPRRDLTDEDLFDLCELATYIEEDTILSWLVHQTAMAVHASRHNGHVGQPTRQQQREASTRLREIVERKLPQQENIVHHGYRILTMVDAARIDSADSLKDQAWAALIEQARAIPNVADRALVLIRLIACVSHSNSVRDELIEMAEATVREIRSLNDRSGRYLALASAVLGTERSGGRSRSQQNNRQPSPDPHVTRAKRLLREAMETSVRANQETTHETQRRIIDLAYGIDQQFADSLAALADDDPARLSKRLRILGVKQDLASLANPRSVNAATEIPSILAECLTEEPSEAWALLGGLHAGRLASVHLEWLRETLQAAASLPVYRAYPILAWVIENAVVRYGQTDQARTYTQPLFRGLLESSTLAFKLAGYAYDRGRERHWRAWDEGSEPSDSTLIPAGSRAEAIRTVREWLEIHLGDTLTIWDPFFSPGDLEWLQLVASIRPDCLVTIITSRKWQRDLGITPPYRDAYQMHWCLHVSDQPPPPTDIAVIGTQSTGETPFHDRLLLTEGAGLVSGTSLNALGMGKDATLRPTRGEEIIQLQKRVDEYLSRRIRIHHGERLEIDQFSI